MKLRLFLCFFLAPLLGLAQTASVNTVATIAALRARALGGTVQVLGYSSAGDGGGGIFVWNALSTATDDGGTVIQPTGVPTGRWLRAWSGAVHAEWWGTSDYGASLSAAAALLRTSGGKILVARNPSGVATTPINLTECINGIVIEGTGGAENLPIIQIAHNGVAIDCTGSQSITFLNFMIATASGYHPTVGYLLARDHTGGSAENHRFINSGTAGLSTFSIAALYNYGSECDEYVGCFFVNDYVGAKGTAIWTQYNSAAVTSPYQTIATGSQSCTVHHIYGGQWQNKSADSTQNLLALEGVSDFAVYGGFWYAPTLNAYILVDTTNTTSSYCYFQGIRGETGSRPGYGVFVNGGTTQSLVEFEFKNMRLDVATRVLLAPSNTTLYLWYWSVEDVNNVGVNVYNCSYCQFDLLDGLTFVMGAGGSFIHGMIRGKPSSITWNSVVPQYSNIFDITTGGVLGSQLGDSAAAGELGEYMSQTVSSGTALTSGTWAAAGSLTLTPGDWDVGGNIDFQCVGATNSGSFQAGISTSSTGPGATETYTTNPQAMTTYSGSLSALVPTVRLTVSVNTAIYLVGKANFSVGTVAAGGRIFARRIR